MGNQRNNRNGQKNRKGDQPGSYFLVSVSHLLLVPIESRMTGVGCRKRWYIKLLKMEQKQRNLRAEQIILGGTAYLELLSSKISVSDYTWAAVRTLAWKELLQLQSELSHPYQGCYEEAGQCFCFPILGWLFLSKHHESHILEGDQANSELVQSYYFFNLYTILSMRSHFWRNKWGEKQMRQETWGRGY